MYKDLKIFKGKSNVDQSLQKTQINCQISRPVEQPCRTLTAQAVILDITGNWFHARTAHLCLRVDSFIGVADTYCAPEGSDYRLSEQKQTWIIHPIINVTKLVFYSWKCWKVWPFWFVSRRSKKLKAYCSKPRKD